MRYGEMIAGLAAAGHDVSRINGATSVPYEPQWRTMTMASVTIGDAADIITSTVHKAVDPLERRVAELEGKVATLQTRVLAAVRVRGTVAT